MGLTTAGGAGLLQYLTQVLNNKQLGRRTPGRRPSSGSLDAMYGGYEQRVADIGSGRKPMQVDLKENLPPEDFNAFNTLKSPDPYASNGINYTTGSPIVQINPNADEAFLAHELGHVASKHTDIGSIVRTLRDNPKLTNVLGGAMYTLPGVAAALEAGDNDMDTSIALAAATAMPTLIDEGLATKNGLAIMNNAGLRASMGQRGKLATGLLSYLAPALAVGASANLVGNMVDQDVPL